MMICTDTTDLLQVSGQEPLRVDRILNELYRGSTK
jgi:hypothetical protein